MRKFLRNMARAKMKRMGYSNVNLKMRGHWREIIGAYPVNIIGRKKNKKGSYSSLFAY